MFTRLRWRGCATQAEARLYADDLSMLFGLLNATIRCHASFLSTQLPSFPAGIHKILVKQQIAHPQPLQRRKV